MGIYKLINKHIFWSVVIFFPITCLSEESLGLKSSALDVLSDYVDTYEDRKNEIDTLLSFFTNDIHEQYQKDIITKSRFITYPLTVILDSPVQVRNNRKVSKIDCTAYEISADSCLIIIGETAMGLPRQILLGFIIYRDRYLINFVRNGNHEGGNFFEWIQSDELKLVEP